MIDGRRNLWVAATRLMDVLRLLLYLLCLRRRRRVGIIRGHSLALNNSSYNVASSLTLISPRNCHAHMLHSSYLPSGNVSIQRRSSSLSGHLNLKNLCWWLPRLRHDSRGIVAWYHHNLLGTKLLVMVNKTSIARRDNLGTCSRGLEFATTLCRIDGGRWITGLLLIRCYSRSISYRWPVRHGLH